MQLSTAICISTQTDGADISVCPAGDLVLKLVEIPDLAFYETVFTEVDPDIVSAVFVGSLLLLALGMALGWSIKFMKSRY